MIIGRRHERHPRGRVEALTSSTHIQTGPAHQPSRAIRGEESAAAVTVSATRPLPTAPAETVLGPDEGAVFFLQALSVPVVL